jgi:hypothetical protein
MGIEIEHPVTEREASMKKTALSLLLLCIVISIAGCAEKEATPTSSPAPTLTPTQQPSPTVTSTPIPTPTPKPTSTTTTTPTLPPTTTPTALFLVITQPTDGSLVSASDIGITGKTIPGAVVSVSINYKIEIANVYQNGNFSATVTLEEGPNFIEVIASDRQGNEKSSTVTVIYLP